MSQTSLPAKKQTKSFGKFGVGKLKGLIEKNIDEGNLLHVIDANEIKQLKTLEEEEEQVIDAVLDEIWRNYNDDGNDFLDKEEMEKFIYITLIENGVRKYNVIEDLRNDQNF